MRHDSPVSTMLNLISCMTFIGVHGLQIGDEYQYGKKLTRPSKTENPSCMACFIDVNLKKHVY